MRLFSVLPIKFYCVERQKILLFFIAAVTVRSAGGQGIRPHKACRAAGLTHGIVRMTQRQRQVVRSQFLHQCADTAPGKPPFIAAAARVFVKVRQPFHGRPFWHGQDECAKQGTVDDIHLKSGPLSAAAEQIPKDARGRFITGDTALKHLSVLHVECEIQKAAREHRTAGFAGTRPTVIQ